MEQILKTEVQNRLTELEKDKQQVEALRKQIEEKENEILAFRKDWQNSCSHAFYRIQWLAFTEWITEGYYCCLCGKYEKRKSPEQTLPDMTPPSYYRAMIHHGYNIRERQRGRSRPIPKHLPETHDYIGTVKRSIYNDSSDNDEERYPIPPEFQAEVQKKNDELHKLEEEEALLEERLQELKKSIKSSETELKDIAHSLNYYFGYPETIIREPHRWSRDDFNYDPFD